MDHPSNLAVEVAKSVNLTNPGLPSESVRSESYAPTEPNEALLKIS